MPDSYYIVIRIDNKYSNSINSVEHFVHPPFKYVKGIKILGYPGWSYAKNDSLFMPFINPTEMPLPKKDYFFSILKDSATAVVDSSVFVIDCPPFMKNADSLGGFSGSPVFIQDSITNNWRIAGIFTSNARSSTGRFGIEVVLIEAAIKKAEQY